MLDFSHKSHLSLVDSPYDESNQTEPVYTLAFYKSKKERDGFIAKVRGNIYGAIKKVKRK